MSPQDIKLTGFELLELLGQGGMGVVWKARQLSLDRLVAIKLLPATIGQDPESIKQIMTEARTAARLKHAGIVQVYDASEEHGHYFFVMEFVNGYNVGQWLARSKVLPWKDALVVVESVAVALDYAWRAAGMIHCDIKPENIMVDQDGTIKVADLGLSRTLESRDDHAHEDIMGTPSYMSPEQVRGDVPLDCRTDIYSLGSTLYQMVTGRRIFHEKPDGEIMDMVLTEQVQDPRDIVQGIPANVCALLQRMLSKDREGRPKDWQAFIQDIRRVEKGLMPTTAAPAQGMSTVMCRKTKVGKTQNSSPATLESDGRRSPGMLLILILICVAVVLFGLVGLRGQDGRSLLRKFGLGSGASSVAPSTAQEVFNEARQWENDHPRQYQAAQLRFARVTNEFAGTPQAVMALGEIKALAELAQSDRRKFWVGVTNRVQGFVNQGQLENAISELEFYNGPLAVETSAERKQWAQALRQKIAEREMAKTEETKWRKLLGQVSNLILSAKWTEVEGVVRRAMAEGSFRIHKADLESVNAVLQATARLSDPVVQSFQNDIGQTVRLKLAKGERAVKIVGITGGKLVVTAPDGRTQEFIDSGELLPADRLARLGSATTPEEALAKGSRAAGLKAFAQAEALLASAGPLLAAPLLERIGELKAIPNDVDAERALAAVLVQAGIVVGPYDEAKWSAAIRSAHLTREQVALMSDRRERYLASFGSSAFLLRASPVLLLLEQVCQQVLDEIHPAVESTEVPAAKGAASAVSTVRTEGDGTKTVEDALREKNPALQADQVCARDGVEGRGLLIVSDEAVDLTPLAGYPGIRSLCIESKGAQKIPLDVKPLSGSNVVELRLKGHVVKDLAALQGLHLRRLCIPGTIAAGFASLEGLPLVELDLSGSSIRDLNSLRGMRLERLNVDDTKIASLMILAGMPLRELSARGVPVRDISVLKSLPLESLNLTQISAFDYQPLRGLSLKRLNLGGARIRNVSFCDGMPLQELILDNTLVSDITALKGKSMERLVLARTPLKDLSPLMGSSIGTLDLTGVRISPRDLAVLARITTTNLNLSETEIISLSSLAGKQLTELSIRNTRVSDLSPLKGMPIRILNIQDTSVNDLEPLRSLPLQEIWITGDLSRAETVINECPQLRLVNGRKVTR